MRLLGGDNRAKKLSLFTDLVTECQLAAPGSRLSDKLRTKMEEFGREDRRGVVGRMTTEGCAPLFLACRNGSSDVVEYLLTTCGADLEQRGQFEVVDEGVSHSVTPLWCAAVSGRLAVVKVLVRHGADVNAVSDSGSTPLRSTCYIVRAGGGADGAAAGAMTTANPHFDIVKCLVRSGADIGKPNYFGGTCLINSVQSPELVRYLLTHGKSPDLLDVNAADVQHKTALHYAVQENRLESTKMLLGAGADPFLRSKYGDDALQMACLKGSVMIFNHLLETVPYEPPRIADAFELMGSTFMLDLHDVSTTLFFWRKALEIRYEGAYRSHPKPLRVGTSSAHPVLKEAEFNSKEELEELSSDNFAGLKTQALLVSERILGPTHKDTVFRFMYAGAAHADSNEFKPCVAFWNHALGIKVDKETLLSCDTSFTVRAVVQLYINILSKWSGGLDLFEDALETARHIGRGLSGAMELLAERPRFQAQLNSFDVVLTSWVHLLHILLRLAGTFEERRAVFNHVDRVLAANPTTQNGDTVLHLAVAASTMPRSNSFLEVAHAEADGDGDDGLDIRVDEDGRRRGEAAVPPQPRRDDADELEHDDGGGRGMMLLRTPLFPSEPVTRFILECGFDVHCRNNRMETPLHIASRCENFCQEVAATLLAHGAHLDVPDLRNICPKDILVAHSCRLNLAPFISLKCLAAKALLNEGLLSPGVVDDPDHDGLDVLPGVMLSFLKMHSLALNPLDDDLRS